MTADAGARERADTLWGQVDDRAHDAEFGGYTEALTRTWDVSRESLAVLRYPPGITPRSGGCRPRDSSRP